MVSLAFCNGDSIKLEDGWVVSLRSGYRAAMVPSPSPHTSQPSHQRTRLKGLHESGGELIDLASHAQPAIAGVSFRNVSMGPAERLCILASKLPSQLDVHSRVARRKLFKTFDTNANGYLSLAEVDRGVRDVIGSGELFDAKPVISRAFHAAKQAGFSSNAHGCDYVEDGCEFRLLLLYLSRYFELFTMFAMVDTSGDRRVDEKELACALPMLRRWGIDLASPSEAFRAMDVDNGGLVLFDEFAHWALQRQLQLEGVREAGLSSENVPPPPECNLASASSHGGGNRAAQSRCHDKSSLPRRQAKRVATAPLQGKPAGEGKPYRQAEAESAPSRNPLPPAHSRISRLLSLTNDSRGEPTPPLRPSRVIKPLGCRPAAERRMAFTLESRVRELELLLRKVWSVRKHESLDMLIVE
ncbi:MAG: hypothetical protein SGPRY_006487 [Prymnesium sp.]